MLVLEVRAFDNYFLPLIAISLNALLATILSEVSGFKMSREVLQHWDAVSVNNSFEILLKCETSQDF